MGEWQHLQARFVDVPEEAAKHAAFGIRACLSEDEGDSWDHANELRIRDDLPNRDLGYPTAVELPDGRVFAAYYGQDAAGVTHIMGSSFGLP